MQTRQGAVPFLTMLATLLVLTAMPLYAQRQASRNWTTIWGWTTASWDGDDKPYQQMRATVDKAIAGGRKPNEMVELYEAPALKAPSDSKAQFKWAYAAYRAAELSDYNTGENILYRPCKALVLGPFPHTYEYARLIFLTEDYADMLVPRLQQVSKRFLKVAPQDTDVKYAAAKNLLYNPEPATRQIAVACVYQLIRARPQWAKPRGLLGFIYYRRWQASKRQSDAAKAIEGYQCFLDLAPPGDPFRQRVQETIAEIRQG